MTLTALRRTGQVICRMPPRGICSFFLLMVRLRLLVWGVISRGEVHSYCILSTVRTVIKSLFITVDTDLDHLAELVFVRFLHCKVVLLVSLPYHALWEEVTTCSPYVSSGALCTPSLRVEYLHKLCGILCMDSLVSF